MRVLIVASEVYPMMKTGGLADVAGALPRALRGQGVEADVVLPFYPQVRHAVEAPRAVYALGDVLGCGSTRLIETRARETGDAVWLVENASLYERPGGPYLKPDGWDHEDNFKRFALLSRAAALLASGEAVAGYAVDVLHANDWQTGLAPAYLKLAGKESPKTVFTVHNLHFAGIFGRDVLPRIDVPDHAFGINGVEFNGFVSYLKAGLFYADRLTTVSPTYAWEITTPEGGRGFEGLLSARAREGRLSGFLNGVDYALWDPRRDPALSQCYDDESVAQGKAANKAELQRELGLHEFADVPLLGMVSRFSDQKGVDVVLQAIPRLIDMGVQLAVLGSGEKRFEEGVLRLAATYPRQFFAGIGYDEPLSHRIQAGSDLFLAPSRFEPCGLTQLYALRYGALPLVRRTGGLADTVTDMADEWNGTGFVFDEPSVEGFLGAIRRALAFYRRSESWHFARQRAMRQDFGWERAARAYVALYEEMLG